ncbi:MAG: helix-turn-helix domain-containing protein [Nitrospiraceae bacterium]|nr:helix-turn-helix domain-containing protein [Nitrospiraceae bacterium]OQW65726.1 MAG: hypothetical protein BVN29_08885 [Nitrospira sp. ST-bin5]
MTDTKTFSKQQIAKIFRVSRSTVYDWEISGCPVIPPERRGYPARLVFEDVLNWRLAKLDAVGVSEAGLALEERLARERMVQFV